jgi:general secretion pathway protein G
LNIDVSRVPLDTPRRREPSRRSRARGFTLLELVMATIVLGVVAALAVSTYSRYTTRARTSVAIRDIGRIQFAVDRYVLNHDDSTPPDLATIGMDGLLDPWGHAYVYLSFAGLHGNSQMRKDRNLVPINTEYDLYSMGPDGVSSPPLTASVSQDDIVRANDGAFIGLASDY